jgi:hypothetical protein
MQQLKLIALDAEDLDVVSAHLQDAVLKVRDMLYMPRDKRFAAVMNRFDWSSAAAGTGAGDNGTGTEHGLQRRQCALRFERVLKAQLAGFDLAEKDTVLSLLAVRFEARSPEDAAGTVTLVFSGNAAVRLDVECVEAELKDLGPVWSTRSRPRHPETGDVDASASEADATGGSAVKPR